MMLDDEPSSSIDCDEALTVNRLFVVVIVVAVALLLEPDNVLVVET